MRHATAPPARRRGRTLSGLVAVALASLLVPGLGAVDEAAAASNDVVLTGRGYGHGIGMSQYGAKGRAEAGHTYAQIVAAYYPGTTLAVDDDTKPITVWIQEDTKNETWVIVEPNMTVQGSNPEAGTSAAAAPLPATIAGPGGVQVAPTAWRLKLLSYTFTLEGYYRGTWYRHRSDAIDATLSNQNRATFAAADGSVRLITATYREHRGVVSANRLTGTTTVRTTVTLPMGQYLRSVVKAEMPATWAAAAVQAQAVAARTYASYDRDVASRPWWYDTCNTTSCQVYRGVGDYDGAGVLVTSFEHDLATAAVAATSGRILTYGGKPAFTQFSASNGGYTLAGSQPYLIAQPDPYDGFPEWTVTLTAAAIQARYPTIGTFTGLSVTRDGKGAYGGRTLTVTLNGSSGSTTVTGSAFRSAFGLRSTLWGSSAVVLPPLPPLVTPQRNWNGDRFADLIGRAPDGKLYLYSGRGNATWAGRVQIGNGWQVMGFMTQVHNFSGTGRSEIITTDPGTGALRLYPSNGLGGFTNPPRVIGNGWGGFTALVGVQGWHSAGMPGLIARDSVGRLLLYPGAGNGRFVNPPRVIGVGWNGMDVIAFAGDLTGDRRPDLMAREASSGDLWLYPGDGVGGFLPRRALPGSWAEMDVILGGADWDSDGRIDVIAREEATGVLWLYPGDGAGGLQLRRAVGHGWLGFTLVS